MKNTQVWPRNTVLVAAWMLVVVADVGAQERRARPARSPVVKRVSEPPRQVHLDLETGRMTRGPRVRSKALSTSISMDNTDYTGFVAADSGGGSCEWWDVANKSIGAHAGGRSGLMTGFSFAYCSAALDTSSFGAGGSAIISFREGYVRGSAANMNGPSGTLVGMFAMSGLPANTNRSSFLGGYNCYQISVKLGTPICFGGDGEGPTEPNVAWGWRFVDLGTDGVLAQTFPYTSCVFSCNPPPGAVPGSGIYDGLGMEDSMDKFCPPNALRGTFTFGGGATSISMAIREAEISTSATLPAASSPNNNGVGPATLSEIHPVGIGVPGAFGLDCSMASVGNKPSIWRVGFGPPTTPLPSKWGDVRVPITAGSGVNFVLGPHGQSPAVLFDTPAAPKDPSLACAPFSLQALCGDQPIGHLSNGLGGVLQLLPLK